MPMLYYGTFQRSSTALDLTRIDKGYQDNHPQRIATREVANSNEGV